MTNLTDKLKNLVKSVKPLPHVDTTKMRNMEKVADRIKQESKTLKDEKE